MDAIDSLDAINESITAEHPAKKPKLKHCLFVSKNQFNQTQKFKLGKPPNVLRCYGLWICLAARSRYMSTIYKDNANEPENLRNLHLMQEVAFDTPLKRRACEYAWNFIHEFPSNASSSTQLVSLFPMKTEEIGQLSVERWKELLGMVSCLKHVIDYFQVKLGELVWSSYLVTLLRNCPVEGTYDEVLLFLKEELAVIMQNTVQEASGIRKKIEDHFKRLQSQCSIDGCTEQMCEASLDIEKIYPLQKNVCEFHFNCDVVTSNYPLIRKLLLDAPHSKSIVRILSEFRYELNSDNKRECIRQYLAKLTIHSSDDGSSATMNMIPLTEKEKHLLKIRYKRIKSEECTATRYQEECARLTGFVERFNLNIDHIHIDLQ